MYNSNWNFHMKENRFLDELAEAFYRLSDNPGVDGGYEIHKIRGNNSDTDKLLVINQHKSFQWNVTDKSARPIFGGIYTIRGGPPANTLKYFVSNDGAEQTRVP